MLGGCPGGNKVKSSQVRGGLRLEPEDRILARNPGSCADSLSVVACVCVCVCARGVSRASMATKVEVRWCRTPGDVGAGADYLPQGAKLTASSPL